jgi:hypothetical protein
MISVRGIDGRGKMISDVGNGSGFLSKASHTAASMRGDVLFFFMLHAKKIAENVLSWIARSATGQDHVPLGVGVSITKGDTYLFITYSYSHTTLIPVHTNSVLSGLENKPSLRSSHLFFHTQHTHATCA